MSDNGDVGRSLQEMPGAEAGSSQVKTTLSDRVRALRLDPGQAGGAGKGSKLPWVLCVLLLIISAAFGFKAFGTPQGPAAKSAAAADDDQAGSGDVALESKGYIIAAHQIAIGPKIGGMITKLNFKEGDVVKKGFILTELEIVDYLADRDRAKATLEGAQQRWEELLQGNRPQEIEQAKFDLEESEKNLQRLKLDYDRNRRLTNDVLAIKDREQSQYDFEAMDRRVKKLTQTYSLMKEGARIERKKAAEADVMQAKADLAKAQWRLDNCIVRAPIPGTILTKKTEEGSIVNPVAFNIATGLCDIADLSDLEVDLPIQERDIAQVYKFQPCRIVSEAFPKRKPYDGVVSRLMPIADRAKGSISVRVKVFVYGPRYELLKLADNLVNPIADLGMFGRGRLHMNLANPPDEDQGKALKPDMGMIVSFLKAPKAEEDKKAGEGKDVADPKKEGEPKKDAGDDMKK